MREIRKITAAKQSERGSTLLLVLAMLSVLMLVAAGLAYTSRIEGTASANFAQATQARIAANTGLPYSITLLSSGDPAPTSPLQPWAQAPAALQQATRNTGAAAAQNSSLSPTAAYGKALRESGLSETDSQKSAAAGIPPASVTIRDLSGLVNLNTIRSDKALARTLQSALGGSGGEKSVSAEAQARAILSLRSPGSDKGRTNKTTTAIAPGMQDPRLGTPPPGMRRIESLDELGRKSADGQSPLFTEQQIEKLRSSLTVFSQSPEVYHLADGTSVPKVSLSGVTTGRALSVLRQAFPDKDEELLKQFAANLQDALDEDQVPTTFGDKGSSHTTVFGVESGAPFITEVYPDAKTGSDKKDAGQFVEIYNPWTKPLLMAGWTLEVGEGQSVSLNVVLPAGGSVVVTDNYSSPDKNAGPDSGSLVAIFGVQGDENQRKVVEDSALSLPEQSGSVRLLDDKGNLIDTFAWGQETPADSTYSYQRDDPRVRVAQLQQGTPFTHALTNQSEGDTQTEAESAFAEVKSFWPEAGNSNTTGTWLRCPVDLLSLSTAYAAQPTTGSASSSSEKESATLVARGWQRPLRQVPEKASATNLDVRVIDLFTLLREDGTSSAELPATAEAAKGSVARQSAGQSASLVGRAGTSSGAAVSGLAGGAASASSHSSPALSYFAGARPGSSGGGQSVERAQALDRISAFRQGSTATAGTLPGQNSGGGSSNLPLIGAEESAGSEAPETLPLLYAYGRINLNTATPVTLHALDGELDGKEHLPAEKLALIQKHIAEKLRKKEVPFQNGSDLLAVLFPKATDTDLKAFAKILDQVTVDSTSFEVISENRVAQGDGKRRQAWAQARWTVALDRKPFSLLSYTSQP